LPCFDKFGITTPPSPIYFPEFRLGKIQEQLTHQQRKVDNRKMDKRKNVRWTNVRWVTDRRAVTSAQADNWIAKTHRQNQNIRWVTDCQAVTSAQADNWIAKTHWQNQNALRFGRFGEPTRVLPHSFRLAPLAENAIHQESPAVGCPPYVVGYADG
jgi:hypothetical protein